MKNKLFITLSIAIVMIGAIIVNPATTNAGGFRIENLLDPLCVFHDCGTTKKYYYNSNNVNSNIESPGAVIYNNAPVVTGGRNTISNSAGGNQAYNYITTAYNYESTGQVYTPPPPAPLKGSCYPLSSSTKTGGTVQWYASAYGGTNVYNYTWTGDEGLSGYGSTINKTYYSPGYKNATVTVTSGNQTTSINCSGGVNVYQDNPPPQNPPPYYPPPQYPDYEYPLSVSCYSNVSSARVNNSVRWTASVSGGRGSYSYYWSGSDNLYGYNSSIYKTYSYPGTKTASVTVTSGNQTITRTCSNSVYIEQEYYNPPVYNPPVYVPPPVQYVPIQTGLDIGCFADPAKAKTNQPVTWVAEVIGGRAPYRYTWTGSDGLTGSSDSIIKYYSTAGSKSAVVSVTSADGKSGSRACTNSVTVTKPTTAVAKKPATPVATPPQVVESQAVTAASLFSLSNVPWGLVAILIILVLFATVIYLLFNRQKI